jgi:hypothetical protein
MLDSNFSGDMTVQMHNRASLNDVIGYFDPTVKRSSTVKYDPTNASVYRQVLEKPTDAETLAKVVRTSPTSLVKQAEAWQQDERERKANEFDFEQWQEIK